MLWKCCTQYASKAGTLSSGHRTGKGQFSFQSQRKGMPKNVQTIALISHASKVMLKILQARLQQYVNELPDVQAGFRKGRGTRDRSASIRWIIKKAREFEKNIYFCFIDYTLRFCVFFKPTLCLSVIRLIRSPAWTSDINRCSVLCYFSENETPYTKTPPPIQPHTFSSHRQRQTDPHLDTP